MRCPLRVALISLILVAGCTSKDTGPKEAPQPKYDPDAITQAVMAEFDKNKDGALDASELRACPALYGAMAAIDANGDRKLSADEIRKRVEAYAAVPTGSIPVTCICRMDGRPLVGGTITFDPEPCMSSVLKSATGTTDTQGQCSEFQIDGKQYRGLPAGLYRIRVNKEGATVAPRFNSQTTLGREIYLDPRAAGVTIELEVMSR
jgi:hypothetical protein